MEKKEVKKIISSYKPTLFFKIERLINASKDEFIKAELTDIYARLKNLI